MKYMFLLFNEEMPAGPANDSGAQDPEAARAMMEPWVKFGEDAAKMATQVAGDALHPSNTATVVSVRDGKRIVTDGPFITTKEQLGGFYIFDCDNLDTAMKLAEMIPWAPTGHIEIRPVVNFD